ncbi:hypothetical protein [Faecalicatena contorta]
MTEIPLPISVRLGFIKTAGKIECGRTLAMAADLAGYAEVMSYGN